MALIVGSAAFASFWLLDIPLNLPDGIWALTLAMHGLAFIAIAVGLSLMGAGMTLTGWQRMAWWAGALLSIAGSVVGWLVLVAGLLILGAFEVAARSLLAGATMITGAVAIAAVYLRGVHYGDEGSRTATNVEEVIAITGVVLVALGFAVIGVGQIMRGVEATSAASAPGRTSAP